MPTTPILQLPYPSSTDSADVPRDIQALAQKLDGAGAGGVFIVGEMRFIAIANPPPGWLVADGRAVSRATYAALFAAIAAVFGAGDGSTTFNLPDARGRAMVGAGQGTGLANRAVGTKWGVEAVLLGVNNLPSHNHNGATGVDSPDHVHSNTNGPFLEVSGEVSTWLDTTNTTAYAVYHAPNTAGASTRHAHSIPSQGGGVAFDNTQPSIAIPAYIFAGV